MEDKFAEFGNGIGTYNGMSRWFKGEPDVQSKSVKTFRETWACPACGQGEMEFNGLTWPMSPQGYHHICTNSDCGFTAALSGKAFPRTVTR